METRETEALVPCPVICDVRKVNYSHGDVQTDVRKNIFAREHNNKAFLHSVVTCMKDNAVDKVIWKQETEEIL